MIILGRDLPVYEVAEIAPGPESDGPVWAKAVTGNDQCRKNRKIAQFKPGLHPFRFDQSRRQSVNPALLSG